MRTITATIEYDDEREYLYLDMGGHLIGIPTSYTAAAESAREGIDRMVGTMLALCEDV